MTDTRPVGVFDSGLGGLTAIRSLLRILPDENLIYFGDTARVPYGNRAPETILQYARQDVRFLRSFLPGYDKIGVASFETTENGFLCLDLCRQLFACSGRLQRFLAHIVEAFDGLLDRRLQRRAEDAGDLDRGFKSFRHARSPP